MIISFIITLIVIIAGCWVAMQMYDLFEHEIIRTLIIVGYGLFVLFMLAYWFIDSFITSLY